MSSFVIDTNLIVSATLEKRSIPFIGIQKIISSGDSLTFSSETFQEATEVILRSKFNRYASKEKREEFLSLCAEVSVFVTPDKHFTHCRDHKDNKFLDAAVAGAVKALITGDTDLLDLKEIETIPILTMSAFLNL